jgi:uncharacterized membrane protein
MKYKVQNIPNKKQTIRYKRRPTMSEETTSGNLEQSEGVAGVGLFVAAYVDERRADEAIEIMKQARKSGDFYFDDAAVIRRDAEGKLHIKETGDMSTGKGAGIALAAHGDAGFDNDSLKEIGAALPAGTSAIMATTSEAFVEEVRRQAEGGATMTFAKEIAAEIRSQLEARQDVLLSMILTEKGVAASKVVASSSAVAVFGIAVTEGAAVVDAYAATEGETEESDEGTEAEE